jgi:hypothetical protein
MAVPTHNYALRMPNYGAQASNEDLGSASFDKKAPFHELHGTEQYQNDRTISVCL